MFGRINHKLASKINESYMSREQYLSDFKARFKASNIDTAWDLLLEGQVLIVDVAGEAFYNSLHHSWALVMESHIKMLQARDLGNHEEAAKYKAVAEQTFRSLQARVTGILPKVVAPSTIQINSPVVTGGQLNVSNEQSGFVQNLTIHSLVAQIDASVASEADKVEAKSRLRSFLEHPLVAAIAGAAAGSIAGSQETPAN